MTPKQKTFIVKVDVEAKTQEDMDRLELTLEEAIRGYIRWHEGAVLQGQGQARSIKYKFLYRGRRLKNVGKIRECKKGS